MPTNGNCNNYKDGLWWGVWCEWITDNNKDLQWLGWGGDTWPGISFLFSLSVTNYFFQALSITTMSMNNACNNNKEEMDHDEGYMADIYWHLFTDRYTYGYTVTTSTSMTTGLKMHNLKVFLFFPILVYFTDIYLQLDMCRLHNYNNSP